MRRGDVFCLQLPRGSGHEQLSPRYGVLVQSDALMILSRVLVAADITVRPTRLVSSEDRRGRGCDPGASS